PTGYPVAPFFSSFAVPGPSNVVATVEQFQDLDIAGQKGTLTAIESGDDDAASISLGSNTFTFFGQTYTILFVSTNGLITLGSPNTEYRNNNLTGSPGSGTTVVTQAAIAVLWDDYISTTGNPMVIYRIDGDQLIIQWNRVNHFDTRGSTITFQ